MLGFLRRQRPDPGPRRLLEASLHEALELGPNDVVRISEVRCGAHGCSDVLLAVMIMGQGRRTQIHRVERDLLSVTVGDLLDAVRPPAADPRAVILAQALSRLG